MKSNKRMKRCDVKSQHKSLHSVSGRNKVIGKSMTLYAHSAAKSGRRETKNNGTGPR